MKSIVVRVELIDATENDCLPIRAGLERKGFSEKLDAKSGQTVRYTFMGEGDVEVVAKVVHESARKTEKHFLIFVSGSEEKKGVGIAG